MFCERTSTTKGETRINISLTETEAKMLYYAFEYSDSTLCNKMTRHLIAETTGGLCREIWKRRKGRVVE